MPSPNWKIIGKNGQHNFPRSNAPLFFVKNDSNPRTYYKDDGIKSIRFLHYNNNKWDKFYADYDFARLQDLSDIKAVINNNDIPFVLYVKTDGTVGVTSFQDNNWKPALEVAAALSASFEFDSLKADHNGYVYATFLSQHDVIVIKSDGSSITRIAAPSKVDNRNAYEINISPNGIIYFANLEVVSHYLCCYQFNLGNWSLLGTSNNSDFYAAVPGSFTFDTNNDVYLALVSGKVFKLQTDPHNNSQWTDILPGQFFCNGFIMKPILCAINGVLFVLYCELNSNGIINASVKQAGSSGWQYVGTPLFSNLNQGQIIYIDFAKNAAGTLYASYYVHFAVTPSLDESFAWEYI